MSGTQNFLTALSLTGWLAFIIYELVRHKKSRLLSSAVQIILLCIEQLFVLSDEHQQEIFVAAYIFRGDV